MKRIHSHISKIISSPVWLVIVILGSMAIWGISQAATTQNVTITDPPTWCQAGNWTIGDFTYYGIRCVNPPFGNWSMATSYGNCGYNLEVKQNGDYVISTTCPEPTPTPTPTSPKVLLPGCWFFDNGTMGKCDWESLPKCQWDTEGRLYPMPCKPDTTPTTTPTSTPSRTDYPQCNSYFGINSSGVLCCSNDGESLRCSIIKPTPTPTPTPIDLGSGYSQVKFFHDDARGVGIWIAYDYYNAMAGIAVLPDSEYRQ